MTEVTGGLDITLALKMENKKELDEYCSQFGYTLDGRKALKNMKKQLRDLLDAEINTKQEEEYKESLNVPLTFDVPEVDVKENDLTKDVYSVYLKKEKVFGTSDYNTLVRWFKLKAINERTTKDLILKPHCNCSGYSVKQ